MRGLSAATSAPAQTKASKAPLNVTEMSRFMAFWTSLCWCNDSRATPGGRQGTATRGPGLPRIDSFALLLLFESNYENGTFRAMAFGRFPGRSRPRQATRHPPGVLLSWRLTAPYPMPFDGVLPFVIDWGDTPHPAIDPALPRVDLVGFTGAHPDPTATAAALAALGVHLPVTPGDAGLTAVLAGPRGRITLR